jgi:hypothetical protein
MTSYSLPEVAEALVVCTRTIEAWIAAGELRAVNVSRDRESRKPRLRVLQADLDAFLAGRATDTTPDPQPRPRRRRLQMVEQIV